MHPIFGRVVAEWSSPSQQISSPAPFLYCVHLNGSDDLTLRVVATDFQSNTFQVIRSRHQLEDLRDDIGIGGSWSEFIDYITTSLKSGDVKLVLDGVSELGGASQAKLICQKAKGMPRILLALCKLVNGAASEEMAILSLELYNGFKDTECSLAEVVNAETRCHEFMEKGSKYHLQKALATEQMQKTTDRIKALSSQIEDFMLEFRESFVSPTMTFPKFDGSEALAWLARENQYFLINKTPLDTRVDVAISAISGPAIPWLQLLLMRCSSLSWDKFAQELLRRFGDSEGWKPKSVAEKNADLQKQLSMTFYSGKHKSQKINDRKDQGSSSAIVSAESPDKKTASDTNARKGTNRVVPAYRRSKVRGAILNDTEDDA
ncbi:hypothetical protein SASPL_131209 [Salvia splendens]|uniref:Uncharacterized protein n=1 Tax=Salvia splendens TaxID=180675 RepID=A0A8X8X7D1_SALSN|nr:hypothetical protein SASPL_131209 [Salvia splendens]